MIAAIEIGGTFTDFVLVDAGGRIRIHKVPSSPGSPSDAAIQGFRECLDSNGLEASRVVELLHGSTVATNLLIERRESPTALIVTKGFRDVLAIQRASKGSVYTLHYRKPKPLVATRHVYEITERIDASGKVVTALDASELDAVVRRILAGGYRSVAVCLLHSYANGSHERRVAEALAVHRGLYVSLSSEVAPEYREYERMSTTVVSSFLRPDIDAYLTDFSARLARLGYPGSPLIMQSNGGVVPAAKAKKLAANMFLSGPAAAANGAAAFARRGGLPRLVSIDVGGTSTDLCLINDGQPASTVNGTSNYTVGGHPLNVMMTDIATIGAGGGSIAQVDRGGLLTVGPRSAGANPGPACYGRGGPQFTLSDAMLLLGLLAEEEPLAGGIVLRPDLAAAAAQPLCATLGLAPLELAERVLRIAAVNMAQALRGVSVKRGFDPRDYVLFPCGGVGPMIAAAVAEEAGISEILVPPHPGIFSALGLALADLRVDYVRSDSVTASGDLAATDVTQRFEAMKRQAWADFDGFGIDPEGVRFRYMVDARYRGQGYELRVEIDESEAAAGDTRRIDARFHEMHRRQYGLKFDERPVEIVSFRMSALHSRSGIGFEVEYGKGARADWRNVTSGFRTSPWRVVARSGLAASDELDGPMLVVEPTTTTVVPAGWRLRRGLDACLRLEKLDA